MKNVLLLTDFSENSIDAMRYALNLFKNELCNFYILHVERSTAYTTGDLMLASDESIYDSIVKKAKHKLSKLVVKLENEFKNKNFTYQILVDYDVLTDAIKQAKKANKIDLVVMGTNGVTGAKEVLFGSNTINVIRKVDCPTLVIPVGFKYRPPEEILLPLDLTDSISGSAFMDLVKFTNQFSKTLHLLRIKPHNEACKEEQKDMDHINYFLKETDYTYHSISNVPLPYVVSCYSQTHGIDLTVLLTHKKTLFERFFMGSSTTKISNETLLPLLIFHA